MSTKVANEQKMLKDICPVCGKEYQYPDTGWKQHTCGCYECVTKYFAHKNSKQPAGTSTTK